MKTKLQILIFLMLFLCLTLPGMSVYAEGGTSATTEAPIVTNELPSTAYLKKEKRSIANTTSTSALASSIQTFGTLSTDWQDPFLPGDGETSNPGNVGAPVGDATLPIILSILLLYIIYKSVSNTSRRRNDI